MATTSTGQNINLAFYQSIEKAIEPKKEGKNQLVLNSVLESGKILTAEQKFELVKLAIEKKDALVFDYISDLKSEDISEEQKDKLIELMEESFQDEENKRPLLSMIERLQNINEKLDNETQHNGAMKIISDLNKKNFKTNPPVYLAGNKGLTQSGTYFKPNHRSFEIEEYQESDYVMPLPVKDANPEQTPIKDGAFTKNPNTKGAKDGLSTREHNLGGPVTKGLANSNTQQNSILSRTPPAIPSRNNNGDGGEHIYEEIEHPSILKKPNEKGSSSKKSNKSK